MPGAPSSAEEGRRRRCHAVGGRRWRRKRRMCPQMVDRTGAQFPLQLLKQPHAAQNFVTRDSRSGLCASREWSSGQACFTPAALGGLLLFCLVSCGFLRFSPWAFGKTLERACSKQRGLEALGSQHAFGGTFAALRRARHEIYINLHFEAREALPVPCPGSQIAAPATKSALRGSHNAAPARKLSLIHI